MRCAMTAFNIEPFQFENAKASVEDSAGEFTVTISGDIDMRDTTQEFLPYLLKIHDALIQNNIMKIKLNMMNLTFMNSNGIKSMINWIMKLTELPIEMQYKVYIISNNDIAWQESTLPVLYKLFPDSIIIEQI
jgi:hypothetical protein